MGIGEDCDIGPNCFIRSFTGIGDDVLIENTVVSNGEGIPKRSFRLGQPRLRLLDKVPESYDLNPVIQAIPMHIWFCLGEICGHWGGTPHLATIKSRHALGRASWLVRVRLLLP